MTYFTAGEWPVTYVGTGIPFFDSGFDPDDLGIQDQFEQMAANLLWNWTDRLYGTITETIQPQRVRTPYRTSLFEGMGPSAAFKALNGIPGFGWLPYYSGGEWLPILCGECGQAACGVHSDPRAIWLPGPISAIKNVTIDGDVLDPDAYRLQDGHTLIRQDGSTWPLENDLFSPPDSVGTWSITFERGVPVPVGGQNAAGLLALELYKASIQDPSCGLPQRIQSITRQGVTMEIINQQAFVKSSRGGSSQQESWTGIFTIDSWINSVQQPRDYAGVSYPGKKRLGNGFNDGYGR